MPIYEYRCLACDAVFSRLFQRYTDATPNELCPECGGDQTHRVMSTFAVRRRADSGPGRAAWPTSWEDTNGGDPETLRYWRRRIEREARLEEKYPELSDPALRNGAGTAAEAPPQTHHHPHEHTHPHEHISGVSSPDEAPHTQAAESAHTERSDGTAHTP